MIFLEGLGLLRALWRRVIGAGNKDEERLRGSWAAMMLYPMVKSATLIAMGPTTPTEGARLGVGKMEMRP